MRRAIIGLIIVAAAALMPSWASADDSAIAKEIRERLRLQQQIGQLEGFSININVEEGTVWMKGYVASDPQQKMALGVAQRVKGVKQVVNALEVQAPAQVAANPVAVDDASARRSSVMINALKRLKRDSSPSPTPSPPKNPLVKLTPQTNPEVVTATGSGVAKAANAQASPASAITISGPAAAAQAQMQAQMQAQYAAMVAYNQTPRPFAPAGYQGVPGANPAAAAMAMPAAFAQAAAGGQPMPPSYHPPNGGVVPARYDHPRMPGYAWPSYAAHPNYAATTYPKQYSANAWPYIGPFYPYPQVPLGWRKVQLEWDDGWWFLDFKAK